MKRVVKAIYTIDYYIYLIKKITMSSIKLIRKLIKTCRIFHSEKAFALSYSDAITVLITGNDLKSNFLKCSLK